MAYDEKTIKADIENHIGTGYSNWYVGIAKDPKERLFKDHNVDEKNGSWIYRKAESREVAERIEKYFIEVHGTQGNPGGGSDETTFVYAYKVTDSTRE